MSERRKGDIRYIFVQNFSGAPVDIMGMELEGEILRTEKQMKEAAKMMEFEYAAVLRDRLIELRKEL